MPPEKAPLPSITAELFAIQQGAADVSAREQERQMREVERYQAYRRLFFDDDGELKADARVVLDDLTEAAGLAFASPSIDLADLAVKEGKRRLLLHLFGRFRLSGEQLDALARKLTKGGMNE